MMAINVIQSEFSGSNIEAITVYVYPQFFWLTANSQLTGISSQIKIEKHTRNIIQLTLEEPLPPNPQQKVVCSGLLGIIPILNKNFLFLIQICKKACKIQGTIIYEIERVLFLPFEKEEPVKESDLTQNEKIQEIKNYLRSYLLIEGYYFAYRYDISLSRSSHAAGFPSKKKFLWNMNIGKNFQKLEDSRWFQGVIQGSIRSFKITLQNNPVQYVLITRRSWAKGGTRFNSRGIDGKGNVANFCQTQQLIFIKDKCFSHLQIRGSVPTFWKQTGLNQAVIIESDIQKNKQVYKKHIDKLIRNYEKVFIVNLLCLDRKGEDQLTYYYQKLVKETNQKNVRYEYFDVHCASKGQKFQRCNYLITQKMDAVIKYFGYYIEDTSTKIVTALQKGVIRVNCLDSLDRTNLIQSKIAYQITNFILESVGINIQEAVGAPSLLIASDNIETDSVLIIHLKNAWADNGDMLSKHYTGTGSTHTNVTRTGKRDIKGLIDHGLKSCMRLYQQFVDDNQKQQVIDILLCQHTETVNLTQIEDRLKQLQDTQQGEFKSESKIKFLQIQDAFMW